MVEVDGAFPINAAGETTATQYFTSYEGAARPKLDMRLSAGLHTVCVYVVGGTDTKNMAQVLVQNTPGAKRQVYELSTQVK